MWKMKKRTLNIMKNKKILLTFAGVLISSLLFAQNSEVTVKKNVVEININLKGEGKVEATKTKKILRGDPERRIIIIKDSDSGDPVAEANVEIDRTWDIITNQNGQADLPDEIEDGEHSMIVTKDGVYVKTKSYFTVENGIISTPSQVSIPKAVDYERIKIVLDWGEYPEDLDSHIYSPYHHVYYSNMNAGNLNLDRDDTTSYGPETVTVRDIDSADLYEYYVFDYTHKYDSYSSALSNSGAQVRVFFNNELIGTFKIKPNQEGIWWHVFDVKDGNKIVVYDTVKGYR